MSFFLKRSRGSVTVLVTLILIPTIFFTGFMTDLARVKLYGNQAVMAADDYGDAVLSYYDNVLKELYGLFSVTQSDEGLAAIAELENYMKTSFDPTSNTVSWSHLGGILNTDLSGFTPYSSATLSFSYTAAEGANLANNDVLSTQIGDFMKFRIAQVLLDGDDDSAVDNVIDAISTVQNTEKNAEAIEQRNELNDLASEAYEIAQQYYEILEKLNKYSGFLSGVNSAYQDARSVFVLMARSDSYITYKNYVTNEIAILQAVAKKERIEEAEKKKDEKSEDEDDEGEDEEEEETETLTAEEEAYIAMYEAYQADPDARESVIRQTLDAAIYAYELSWDSEPVDFDNFDSLTTALKTVAGTLSSKLEELSRKRSELETTLSDSSISDEVRDGIEEELTLLDSLFDVNGSYSATNYINLADYIADNSSRNTAYETQAASLRDTLVTIEEQYLTCADSVTSIPAGFSYSDYQDFQNITKYQTLYNALKSAFGSGGSSEDEERAEKAQEDSENATAEAESSLSASESTSARDIPSSFGFGTNGSGNDFAITKLIKTAASYFSANSFAEAGNALLLKVYTVEYDFGMFSSRVTNVSSDESSSEKATSLTGYEMSKKINYLYGAELEYLFGGYNSSTENLNSAKNKILAFRAVMNFTATYTVGPVDTAIKGIADAAAVVNPLLGFAVSGALRLAVAGIETAADWNLLKSGESVPLMKTDTGDLTGLDSIASLLGVTLSDDKSGGVELDYEQYLMIMLLFMTTSDELIERTGNLICLNVNTVEQGISESGTLSTLKFTMDKAVTAINATCQIHLDFVIMQNGFAQQVVDSDTYAEIEAFEENSYKFTVTRGY